MHFDSYTVVFEFLENLWKTILVKYLISQLSEVSINHILHHATEKKPKYFSHGIDFGPNCRNYHRRVSLEVRNNECYLNALAVNLIAP